MKTAARRTTPSRWRTAVNLAATITIAAAVVTACAPVIDYHGYLPRTEDIRKVRLGQSKAEIQALLGSPSTTATIDREGDTFYYISSVVENLSFLRPRVIDREILAIRFGRDGRVSDFAHYGLEDGRIIDFISRKTPTRGREMTILKQLFQNIGRFGGGGGGGGTGPGT